MLTDLIYHFLILFVAGTYLLMRACWIKLVWIWMERVQVMLKAQEDFGVSLSHYLPPAPKKRTKIDSVLTK
jgi:uncharacterized membrane protein